MSGTRSAKQLIYGDEISSGAEQRGDGLGRAQPLHLNVALQAKREFPGQLHKLQAHASMHLQINKRVCDANKSAGSVRNFLESLLAITSSRLRRVRSFLMCMKGTFCEYVSLSYCPITFLKALEAQLL